MESFISQQKACSGRDTGRVTGVPAGFGSFLIDVKSSLRSNHVKTLVTAFDFKPSEREEIESNEDAGLMFVQSLTEKGIISPTDISALIRKLQFCGLRGIADDVDKAFERYISETNSQSNKSQEYEDKKTKFKKQLRNKYKKLCGGIRPVPFLREKYNIEKLYVQSEIKFLEDCQGRRNHERQKWTRLSSYKKIFTDSRVKSKRYIVDGEPGIGKSTLALQITHDWCHGTSPMDGVEILILLRLRQCQKSPSFYSAIKQQLLPKDSKLSENDIENILNDSTTLVVLDGYDEFPDKGSNETNIEDIITGEMLPECDVILMTRTSCLPEDVSSETMRIRVCGFDSDARHTYFRNVVAMGDAEKANKMDQLLSENPVILQLCMIPLFFVMISHLIYENVSCRSLRSSTELLRLAIACLQGHDEIKKSDGNKRNYGKLVKDHSKLDKVAFEGLSGDVQQTSWIRDTIRDRIGHDFYDECVRVGILIEDDIFDFDTIEYKTEVRFHHKLFHEWYAAQHLAKEAARADVKFRALSESEARHERPANFDDQGQQVLTSLDPDYLHNVYRFACGLNAESALKIIEHLTKSGYTKCTLLCIREWGGCLANISDTVATVCSRSIEMDNTDGALLHRSTVDLLTFATSKEIPVSQLWLRDFLDKGVIYTGTLQLKSNLCLPVLTTLKKLVIWEEGREITQEETASILQYSAQCLGLKKLEFGNCLLPKYTNATEPLSFLRARSVTVSWLPPNVGFFYFLNLKTGRWEKHKGVKSQITCSPMTDEDYCEVMMEVRRWAKFWRDRSESDSEDSS